MREQLSHLAPELGERVLRLVELGDEDLVEQAHQLSRTLRAERRERAKKQALDRAYEQVSRLVGTSAIRPWGVELQPAELLHRDLVRAPGFKFLSFAFEGTTVVVRLDVLRRAAKVLMSKSDLMAYLRDQSLCLRWGLGRGGLNLRYTRGLSASEQVLPITFERRRPAGAWLGELLADFGWVS